jgi:triacylglycerol esterase/lipase EstA (alpha/beta hydrolase family)
VARGRRRPVILTTVLRRLLPAILTTLALAAAPGTAAAADPAYAPPDTPGPALDVSQDKLAASLECSPGIDHAQHTPVLLVPGTGATAKDNFSWNYEPAFDKLGIPWCAVTFPYSGNGDIQVNGEYVVYAIRTMYARAGRRISTVGHSQGGMVPRWALRFWPDTRAMVDDVIGFAGSNHGSSQTGVSCGDGECIEADWQQGYMSNFIRALNSFGETFSGISYTNVYTHNDEIVQPNSDDTGSSSLHTGSGRIANVAVQDICPADTSEHFLIGTIDATAYALAIDALEHDGPADAARVPVTVCAQPLQPGVDPATGPAAGLQALYDDESSTGPETKEEPPLACYVTASCPRPPKPHTCTATREIVFHLHAGRRGRIVEVRVFVDGRRVLHRRAHRLRVVSIGRLPAGKHTIRVVTRANTGVRHISVRKVRGCALTPPHTRRARR